MTLTPTANCSQRISISDAKARQGSSPADSNTLQLDAVDNYASYISELWST